MNVEHTKRENHFSPKTFGGCLLLIVVVGAVLINTRPTPTHDVTLQSSYIPLE